MADAAGTEISVVVVSLEGRRLLEECLPALEAQDHDGAWEILVVDNETIPSTRDWLRRAHPAVRVLALEQNLGFAEGANRGAAAARGEWLAFVNDDAVADAGLLRALQAAAQAHAADAVAGRLLDAAGARTEFGGGGLNVFGFGFPYGAAYPQASEPAAGSELPFACGGAMLVRRALFLDLGGFDADFFAYYEDVDFGWRLRLSGHRLVYAPLATVRHRGQATAGRFSEHWRHFHSHKNTLLTLLKNAEHVERLLPGALALLFSRIASFHGELARAHGRGALREAERWLEAAAGAAEGLVWVLDRLEHVLAARAAVQARRRVSDGALHAAVPFTAELGPPDLPDNVLAARLAQLLDVEAILGAAARPAIRDADCTALQHQNALLRAELSRLRTSWSWRALEPLRRLIDRARGLRNPFRAPGG